MMHFFMVLQEFIAGSLAFKYRLVHFIWLTCITGSCIFSVIVFHDQSESLSKPDGADLSASGKFLEMVGMRVGTDESWN